MYKVKFLSLFALLALLLSFGPGTAMAQGPVTSGGPVNQWTSAELERFVDLVRAEQISVPQTQAIYAQLTDAQKKAVADFLAAKAGISLRDWRRFAESYQKTHSLSTSRETVLLGYAGEIWRQPVENTWTNGPPPGSAYADSYWVSWLCDDDPNDQDWTFHYSMSYSQNPDGLRWTATSAQVYLAFMFVYGGNLNGYAFHWSEVNLCIGTTGVDLAGGAENVKNGMYLHPNN